MIQPAPRRCINTQKGLAMQQHFKTFDEIREAVSNGETVYWASDLYEVREAPADGCWLIICTWNGHATGLEGDTADLQQFYTRCDD